MSDQAPDSIITVDQLRSEIGNPTADPRESTAVLDEELEAIIQRETKNIERRVMSRLEKRVLESTPPSASHVFEEVEVSMIQNKPFAEGEVPPDNYPITFYEAKNQNDDLFSYDSSLEAESVGYFTRRRFRFVGEKIIAIPSNTTTMHLRLPNKAETNETVGADVIEQVNSKIIERAAQMVERKGKVGQSLDQPDLDQ